MAMRVLQLGPYPPPHGGVQNNLTAIHRFLRKRDIPSAIINLSRYRKDSADDVYYPKNWLEVLWLLIRLKYDIAHLHIGGNVTARLMGLGFVCCLLPRRKAVLTFHSGGYPRSRAGQKAHPRSLLGFILRRFDRVIGVNAEIMQLFRAFGIPESRTRLIYPHAVTQGQPADTLPEDLQRFFSLHQPVLVTVGLLEPEYDLPLQIDTLGVIRNQHPKAGLLIVGSGSLEHELRRMITRKPYAADVLLCGDVPHGVTLRAIMESDVFLRTTIYDGDSIAVREALHLDTPVIATDNSMRPERVQLIPQSDPEALRDAIEQHLSQPKRSQPRAKADEKNIEEVYELYASLVGGPEGRNEAVAGDCRMVK